MKMNKQSTTEALLATGIGIWEWYVQTGEATVSERYLEILGHTPDGDIPLTTDKWTEYIHPDDLVASYAKLERCFNKETEYYEHLARMKHKEGHWVWVNYRGRVVEWNEDSTPKRMVGSHNDVTEEVALSKQLESELREKESLLDQVNIESKKNILATEVILAGRLGTWEWYVQTGETKFNERWADIIGYTLDELEPINIDTWMKFAHPADLEESNAKLQKCFNKEVEYYDHLARMKHKEGHWVWVQDRGRVIEWNEDGTPKRMVGSHNDLTEEVDLRQRLSIALTQTELLLDEVHHRVKNNLLTLRSLAQIKAKNGLVELKEINDAITAVSKMHEAVYLTESYELVTVRWYLERVLKEMVIPEHATLSFDIEETNEYWKTENLVSLGIIVTELISNSCKHAKNDKGRVNITVSLAEKNNQLLLTIKDDGGGFSGEIPELETSDSIGFMLVDMYAQKLNGTYTFWNDNGAVAQCVFPLVGGNDS